VLKVDFDYNEDGLDYQLQKQAPESTDLELNLFVDLQALNGWNPDDLNDSTLSGLVITDVELLGIEFRVLSQDFISEPSPETKELCEMMNNHIAHEAYEQYEIYEESEEDLSEDERDYGDSSSDDQSCDTEQCPTEDMASVEYTADNLLVPSLFFAVGMLLLACCLRCARRTAKSSSSGEVPLLAYEADTPMPLAPTAPQAPVHMFYPQPANFESPATEHSPEQVSYVIYYPKNWSADGLGLAPQTVATLNQVQADFLLAKKLQDEELTNQ
jgi:hypothetical protein